jgi:glucosamine--fructose-6-phosphate aminotransferase (isomerizing)
MCGIFGYVTNKEEAIGPILIEAAKRLTYRGYDSVGIATLNGGKIDLRKDIGKVEEVAAKYQFAEMRGSRGIVQLRWATFGEPSQLNAQPHLDTDGDLVGAGCPLLGVPLALGRAILQAKATCLVMSLACKEA